MALHRIAKCCPRNELYGFYPSFSQSGLHTETLTYIDDAYAGNVFDVETPITHFFPSGSPDLANDPAHKGYIRTGIYPFFRVATRTHDGTFWIFGGSWAGMDGPEPDIAKTYSTELTLHQIPFDGGSFTYEVSAKVLRHIEGLPQILLEPKSFEWSPIEDCFYGTVDHIPDEGTPAGRFCEVVRITFDGTMTTLMTTPPYVPGGNDTFGFSVVVAADGAIWWAVGGVLYRREIGGSPEVVTLSVDRQVLAPIISPPWQDMFVMVNVADSTSIYELVQVRPDGTTTELPDCAKFRGSLSFFGGGIISVLRTEDFARTFVFTRWGTDLAYRSEINWKKCGSGWVVGGMSLG